MGNFDSFEDYTTASLKSAYFNLRFETLISSFPSGSLAQTINIIDIINIDLGWIVPLDSSDLEERRVMLYGKRNNLKLRNNNKLHF